MNVMNTFYQRLDIILKVSNHAYILIFLKGDNRSKEPQLTLGIEPSRGIGTVVEFPYQCRRRPSVLYLLYDGGYLISFIISLSSATIEGAPRITIIMLCPF